MLASEETPYSLEKREIRRSHERAAASYDEAAVLAREVWHRMFERLQYIRATPRIVLDAGSGTGYGAAKLAERFPDSSVILLDIAHSMLRTGKTRTPWWQRQVSILMPSRVLRVCADLERMPLVPGAVGMVWSNLALQWCDPIRALREAHRVLQPGGLLMFSTLGPDTLKELRAAFRSQDKHTHTGRFMDMHDIGDALIHNGFADPVMDMEMITLTYPDAPAMMRELKRVGAHNATAGRRRSLMGRSAWHRALQAYEQYRVDGKIPATFEVVYGHAWKAKPGPLRTQDGRQVIQIKRTGR